MALIESLQGTKQLLLTRFAWSPCTIAPVTVVCPTPQNSRTQELCVCLEVSPAVLSELPCCPHAFPSSLTLVPFRADLWTTMGSGRNTPSTHPSGM